MKSLLLLLALIFSLSATSEEVKVKKMLQDGDLERSFVLETSLKEKVVLDCQSFIQGLRIGEQGDAIFFMMDPNECESLQERVMSSLKRHQLHCIDVDSEIRSDYACQ